MKLLKGYKINDILIKKTVFLLFRKNVFYCFSLPTRGCLFLVLALAILSSCYAPLSEKAFLETALFLGLFMVSLTMSSLYLKNSFIFNTVILISIITSCVFYQTKFFSLYLYALIHQIPLKWPMPFTKARNPSTASKSF